MILIYFAFIIRLLIMLSIIFIIYLENIIKYRYYR